MFDVSRVMSPLVTRLLLRRASAGSSKQRAGPVIFGWVDILYSVILGDIMMLAAAAAPHVWLLSWYPSLTPAAPVLGGSQRTAAAPNSPPDFLYRDQML